MDRGNQYLGLTGGLESADVTIVSQTLNEFCKPRSGLIGTWTTRSVYMLSKVANSTREFTNGGAGIVVTVDKKGAVTANYGGMKAGLYTMVAAGKLGQKGSMTCEGVESGTVQLPKGGTSTGPWAYTTRQYGLTGVVVQTFPPGRAVVRFPPNQGGCSMGGFPPGLPNVATWRITADGELELSYDATATQPIPSSISLRWTLTRS